MKRIRDERRQEIRERKNKKCKKLQRLISMRRQKICCLLEMGKHAKTNKHYIPLQDLQINCPNCRQPIFVVALMARQVTLNYPISSILEALRLTMLPEKKDASTNTEKHDTISKNIESKSDSESDDDPPCYYNKSKIDDMASDLDELFKSFRIEQSVLTDCQDEVERIREEFASGYNAGVEKVVIREQERLRNNRNRKRGRKPRQTNEQFEATNSSNVENNQDQWSTRKHEQKNAFSSSITPYVDPAILSFAVGHDGKTINRGPVPVNLMDLLNGASRQ